MSNKELECVKDVMLSNTKTQDIWFDISDGFVETLKEKDKEIERLTFESTKWESKFYDEAKKVDRAIEFIIKNENNISSIKDLENNKTYNSALLYVKSILQGSDKE